MVWWKVTLVAALVVGAGGCSGDGPGPSLTFPDTTVTADGQGPAEDLRAPDDSAAPDTGQDGVIGPEDSTTPDAVEDTSPPLVCEADDDCTHFSDDPCTLWFCHPTQGICMPATFPDDDPCDDGDLCTVGDHCTDGVCVSGEVIPPPEVWDDPCNALVCDPALGWHPEPVDGPCDDDDPCTGGDQCVDGLCLGGEDLCQEPGCGDGHCEAPESCTSCPKDCGPCEANCCAPHEGAGCDNPTCQEIVCDGDVFCCNGSWDDLCAQSAVLHCGICDGGPACGDGSCDLGESCESCPWDCDGACDSDCCVVHPGSTCQPLTCQEKVCQQDDFCCEEGWDDYCVETAQAVCGVCQ